MHAQISFYFDTTFDPVSWEWTVKKTTLYFIDSQLL